MKNIVDKSEEYASGEVKAALEAQIVTGKLRVEYQWQKLSEEWRKAYEGPLVKAVKVYFDHQAIDGVPKDIIVDPRKILGSRFVLTNKGGELLINLNELKLIPGMFVAFHPDGRLRAVVTIHVDDIRYAGDDTAQEIWDALHEKLKFGQHRMATEDWQKLCDRYEKQDPRPLSSCTRWRTMW